MFIGGAVIFIKRAVIFIRGAVTSIKGAVTSIRGTIISVGKGSSTVGKSFKTARVKVSDIKGVNKYNLKQWLIIYKLKGPLLLIYSLIFFI